MAKKEPQNKNHLSPKDYNKLRRHSLGASFAPVGTESLFLEEILCCHRCSRCERVVVTPEMINNKEDILRSEKSLIHHAIKKKGWISSTVYWKQEQERMYNLCPICISNDFETYQRFDEFFSA